jgi:hypothetical protein
MYFRTVILNSSKAYSTPTLIGSTAFNFFSGHETSNPLPPACAARSPPVLAWS